MPDKSIEMQIGLDDHGVADLRLVGRTSMPCWCGQAHNYTVDLRLRADPTMERIDMDDLELALRGDERAANRIGWRLMHRCFFYETPPCERKHQVETTHSG